MDEPAIETAGLAPVGSDLATIDEILNPDDLPVLLAHLHAYGVPALFRFGAQTDLEDATMAIAEVDQDGLGLPDRDYYLKTDAHSAELRDKYVATIQKIFELAGAKSDARGGRREGGAVDRDRDGRGDARPRQAARPGEHAAPDDDQRAAGAVAELQLAQVRGAPRKRRRCRRSTSRCPTTCARSTG